MGGRESERVRVRERQRRDRGERERGGIGRDREEIWWRGREAEKEGGDGDKELREGREIREERKLIIPGVRSSRVPPNDIQN